MEEPNPRSEEEDEDVEGGHSFTSYKGRRRPVK